MPVLDGEGLSTTRGTYVAREFSKPTIKGMTDVTNNAKVSLRAILVHMVGVFCILGKCLQEMQLDDEDGPRADLVGPCQSHPLQSNNNLQT